MRFSEEDVRPSGEMAQGVCTTQTEVRFWCFLLIFENAFFYV